MHHDTESHANITQIVVSAITGQLAKLRSYFSSSKEKHIFLKLLPHVVFLREVRGTQWHFLRHTRFSRLQSLSSYTSQP